MSFCSTWLHLPFSYSPGFISLSLLVSQLGQSLRVIDLESTAVVLSYGILNCSVPMCSDSSSLPFFLVPPNTGWFPQFRIECIDEHGCQSQHVSNSNSASIKHLSLLPSPTASSQQPYHTQSIIYHPSFVINGNSRYQAYSTTISIFPIFSRLPSPIHPPLNSVKWSSPQNDSCHRR